MAKRLITVNDVLAGDVACLDRIYLNGWTL